MRRIALAVIAATATLSAGSLIANRADATPLAAAANTSFGTVEASVQPVTYWGGGPYHRGYFYPYHRRAYFYPYHHRPYFYRHHFHRYWY